MFPVGISSWADSHLPSRLTTRGTTDMLLSLLSGNPLYRPKLTIQLLLWPSHDGLLDDPQTVPFLRWPQGPDQIMPADDRHLVGNSDAQIQSRLAEHCPIPHLTGPETDNPGSPTVTRLLYNGYETTSRFAGSWNGGMRLDQETQCHNRTIPARVIMDLR